MNEGLRGESWPGRVGSWRAALLLSLLAWPGAIAQAQDATGASLVAGAPRTGVEPSQFARGLGTIPGDDPANRPNPVGFFNVAYASIFGGSNYGPWRPLPLRTLFTEGWDEPWVPEPNESGDAQQGWINAADGNFYRLSFFSYNYTNGLARGGNGNSGAYTLYTPLSRRLELITFIPFVTSQPLLSSGKQGFSNPSTPTRSTGRPVGAGFGDLSITPRVMLIDSDNVGVNAQMVVQLPTGDRSVGAGQSILTPGAQFWWNFGEGWVMRGGFNAGVGTNKQAGGTTLLSQYALGRIFTPHDVPLFGDLTFYLSANVFNTVSASQTTVTLTPGFRTHLGKDWYALGGLEIPVTGPLPYRESAIFWLMKTF